MKSFDVLVSDDGSITLPEEALNLLKIRKRRNVTLFLEGGVVHILPGALPLEEVRASVPSIEHSQDWDIEIEEAIDEALREKYG